VCVGVVIFSRLPFDDWAIIPMRPDLVWFVKDVIIIIIIIIIKSA